MCAYKLVTCEFKWWGLQGKVEKFIVNVSKKASMVLQLSHLKFANGCKNTNTVGPA